MKSRCVDKIDEENLKLVKSCMVIHTCILSTWKDAAEQLQVLGQLGL
jgi:hypothetical protein